MQKFNYIHIPSGHAILNDPKYCGHEEPLLQKNQMCLWALEIQFPDPAANETLMGNCIANRVDEESDSCAEAQTKSSKEVIFSAETIASKFTIVDCPEPEFFSLIREAHAEQVKMEANSGTTTNTSSTTTTNITTST